MPADRKNPATALGRLFFYTRPYLWIAGLSMAGVLATNGFAFAIPWLIKRAVDLLRQPGGVELVSTYAGLIIAAALSQGLTRWAGRVAIFDFNRSVEKDLRCGLFAHLQRMHPGFLQEVPAGDILSRATNDLNQVRMAIGIGAMLGFNTLVAYVGSITLMLFINWRLTLWAILPYPVVILLVRSFSRLMHARYLAAQESLARLSTRLQENYAGHHVVQAYVREEHEIATFQELNQDYLQKSMAGVRTWGILFPAMAAVGGIGSLVVLWVGGRAVIRGDMSLGDFVAFNAYLGMLLWPSISMGWVLNLVQRGATAMQRIEELFQRQPAIVDGSEDWTSEIVGRSEDRTSDERAPSSDVATAPHIEFRNFTFAYPSPGSAPSNSPSSDVRRPPSDVLHDITLTIEPGEIVAILGPIGAGKTTLVQTLPRLISVLPGRVFLDGVDVTTLPLAGLRQQIAFVPQDGFLFSKTLAENIAYGKPARTSSVPVSEAVRYWARVAHLDEDVQQFPQGYDTAIGERGLTLSGGQRQRVTIARALFLQAPILVLDDAFSNIDTATERSILEDLGWELTGKTVLMVTHRVSTAQIADRIVILERGCITETGTHTELLARGGLYARLYRRQQLAAEMEAL